MAWFVATMIDSRTYTNKRETHLQCQDVITNVAWDLERCVYGMEFAILQI